MRRKCSVLFFSPRVLAEFWKEECTQYPDRSLASVAGRMQQAFLTAHQVQKGRPGSSSLAGSALQKRSGADEELKQGLTAPPLPLTWSRTESTPQHRLPSPSSCQFGSGCDEVKPWTFGWTGRGGRVVLRCTISILPARNMDGSTAPGSCSSVPILPFQCGSWLPCLKHPPPKFWMANFFEGRGEEESYGMQIISALQETGCRRDCHCPYLWRASHSGSDFAMLLFCNFPSLDLWIKAQHALLKLMFRVHLSWGSSSYLVHLPVKMLTWRPQMVIFKLTVLQQI